MTKLCVPLFLQSSRSNMYVGRRRRFSLTSSSVTRRTNSSLDQEDPQTPTAAAEEIPRVTQNIILEFNEDINHQRRLLDLVWKSELKLHKTGV